MMTNMSGCASLVHAACDGRSVRRSKVFGDRVWEPGGIRGIATRGMEHSHRRDQNGAETGAGTGTRNEKQDVSEAASTENLRSMEPGKCNNPARSLPEQPPVNCLV